MMSKSAPYRRDNRRCCCVPNQQCNTGGRKSAPQGQLWTALLEYSYFYRVETLRQDSRVLSDRKSTAGSSEQGHERIPSIRVASSQGGGEGRWDGRVPSV